MIHLLNLRFEQLEAATEKLLQTAADLGPRAYTPPAPGQWAAAQVVHHLIASEAGIAQYIQHKLKEQHQLRKTGLRGWVRARLLRLALRLPGFRFKAPRSVAGLIPPDASTVAPLPELRQQWLNLRRQLEQLLNEFPGPLTNRAIFKHPRAGMLTIRQTLDFMVDHVLHHQQQLQRIVRALGPAGVSDT